MTTSWLEKDHQKSRAWLARLKQFFSPLCRLQWKLTLVYALVTTITILLLEIAGLTLIWYFTFRSEWLPDRLAREVAQSTADLVPYLQPFPADRAGLQRWLEQDGAGRTFAVAVASRRDRRSLPGEDSSAVTVVVDRAGKVVAAIPAEAAPVGASPRGHLPLPATTLVETALAGQTTPDRLSVRAANGDVFLAAPVTDSSNRVLGAVLTLLPMPGQQFEFLLGTWTGVLLPSALIVIPATAIIGLLFGFVTARSLTGRLQRLTRAATAWGQGDFTRLTHDTSGDELGQLARHLNHMAIQLQHLLETRQELATLEERNRLARDLHDSIKQQVFATAMQVAAVQALLPHDPQAAQAHLAESRRLVQQTQQELTGLIHELRPAALDGRGLPAALREHAAEWSQQTGIPLETSLQGERPLPLLLEQTIFRVVQEALTNVARHSQATGAELHLTWSNGDVTLTVTDNGRGFNPVTVGKKSIGLRSMQERVETLGGQFDIRSRPDQGTKLTIRLPQNASES